MNLISPTAMIRGAAMFLLTTPPIEELPDDLVDIVSKVRAGTIPKNSGLAYLEQTKNKLISDWIAENERLSEELKGWSNI